MLLDFLDPNAHKYSAKANKNKELWVRERGVGTRCSAFASLGPANLYEMNPVSTDDAETSTRTARSGDSDNLCVTHTRQQFVILRGVIDIPHPRE
ncbi:MAG: hypothetical protein OEM82_09615 [Acidobacteriota bacterium]|nr:hypothetical protein [Acidobacteriota bacterium]MDH3531065.1 hypothetical protein [Acidobacteriota bacterium]